MFTRRAKAYSSSCLQTVSLSLAIAAAEDRIKLKPVILEVQGLSKSSMLIRLKNSSLLPICNRFHERLSNNGKITTFTGVPLFDALVRRFP